jgi:hypothetical protein
MVNMEIFSFKENPHGRPGNRTRYLMISSQKLWPLDHEAGLCNFCENKISHHGCPLCMDAPYFSFPTNHTFQTASVLIYQDVRCTTDNHHVVTSIFCCGSYLDHNKYSVYHLQVVLLILGSFSVCWLPYIIVTCTVMSGVCTNDISLGYKVTFSLAMVNSCVNPIIYSWKNPEFRQAIKRLLHCSSPNRIPPTPSFIMANKISFRTTGTNVDSSEHQTTAVE